MIRLKNRHKQLFLGWLGLYLWVLPLYSIRTTNLSHEDPIPLYTVKENRYLLDKKLNFYKDDEYAEYNLKRDFFSFSIAPFGVAADRARNYQGIKPQLYIATTQNLPNEPSEEVPLGDVHGRTALIPLVYGPEPVGQSLPDVLLVAKDALFGGYIDQNGEVDEAKFIDQNEEFGYLSVNFKYRKKGVRFGWTLRFAEDFGLRFATSVASLKKSMYNEIKYTDAAARGDLQSADVTKYLYDQTLSILDALGKTYIDEMPRVSMEDLKASIFWRRIFELNIDQESVWNPLLLIPYLECIASVAPGATTRPEYIFDGIFGNNQHASVGFVSGIYLDFIDTVYVSGEVGFTHFFKRDVKNMAIPNSPYQQNLYPFSTDVSVHPGGNWHFALKMGSDYFFDAFSMYVEYVMMEHKRDTITLKEPDFAFLPNILEAKTAFKSKVINAGLTYAISPNIEFGFVWQIPVTQRGAYKSTTVMFSFDAAL